jgi:putative endonuclease
MGEVPIKHFVYILKCRDNTLYTGYTTDVEKRCAVHNKGKGAKYTRPRRPVKVVHVEEFDTKSEALKREYAIKQMTRRQKEKLCKTLT